MMLLGQCKDQELVSRWLSCGLPKTPLGSNHGGCNIILMDIVGLLTTRSWPIGFGMWGLGYCLGSTVIDWPGWGPLALGRFLLSVLNHFTLYGWSPFSILVLYSVLCENMILLARWNLEKVVNIIGDGGNENWRIVWTDFSGKFARSLSMFVIVYPCPPFLLLGFVVFLHSGFWWGRKHRSITKSK